MISVMIMANVLVKNIMVLKNVMNVLMDILVSPIVKHAHVMIKELKMPFVMLVENVHVKPMLLEVIVIHVNMSIMVFQIAKVSSNEFEIKIALCSQFYYYFFYLFQPVNVMHKDQFKMSMNMPIAMTMEGVLAQVPILLGINVINVLQVKFLNLPFSVLRGMK